MADGKSKSHTWRIDRVESDELHHTFFEVKINPEFSVFGFAYINRPVASLSSLPLPVFAYELKYANNFEVYVSGELSVEVKGAGNRSVWMEKNGFLRHSVEGKAALNVFSGAVTVVFNVAFKETLMKIDAMMKERLFSGFAKPLLQDKTFCDVVVVCQNKTFDCHKIILAQRSEFFKTTLTADFKEARTNRVEITTFKPCVVENMLKFIYEDELPEVAFTLELFEAAKMYQVGKLEERCISILIKNLSVDSCCQMLEAAFVHDLNDYFPLVVDFLKKNKDQVAETEGWQRVKKNEELMEKIVFQLMN